MNQIQNLATLLLRLAGAAVAVAGVAGPLYFVTLAMFGGDLPSYGSQRWIGSIVWILAGASLIVFSKPLGRWFGRGLG